MCPPPCQYFHYANTAIGVAIRARIHLWSTFVLTFVFLIHTKLLLWLLCYYINCCVGTKQEVAQEQPRFKHSCHVMMLSVTVWFAVTSGPLKGPNVGGGSTISLSSLVIPVVLAGYDHTLGQFREWNELKIVNPPENYSVLFFFLFLFSIGLVFCLSSCPNQTSVPLKR